MSQQEQKPQWFWCNKHGDFAVRPICPECEHLGQAFTSSVTPAPPEASHRALREKVQGLVDEFDRVARRHREQGTDEYANAYEDVVVKLRAALSTGTETQEL
jgi:hypothetical protein